MFSSQNSQVSSEANYIEDVFSTYLYTGNGSTQTITNGIDLSTKGGLVWIKSRTDASDHSLEDTLRTVSIYAATLSSNTTAAQSAGDITGFTTSGFSLRDYTGATNSSGTNYASWTFRKQPKFFDVLTYTGNGTAGTAISHSLGSTPGFILVKRTDTGGSTGQNWVVWHRSAGGTGYFNSTNALDSSFPNSIFWGNGSSYVAPTSTTFTVTDSQNVNASGGSYVAYLFAHNAGGFGLTGTDNVISCGSCLGSSINNLGFEPQWVLVKSATSAQNWYVFDNMRGLTASNPATYDETGAYLWPNSSAAEGTFSNGLCSITATGFDLDISSSQTYIYIAIRRGPMKVPTSGTSVYNNLANRVGTSATATISGVGFPVDLMIPFNETSGSSKPFVDRLRGATKYLLPPYTNAEQTETNVVTSFASNDGVIVGADATLQVINNYYNASRRYAASFFRRAPSFFDEVCYTGNATSGATQTHNLGVVPEMMIVKNRSAAGYDWFVYHKNLTSAAYYLNLNSTAAESQYWNAWNSTQPTSSVFTIGNYSAVNASGNTYVAYLFATCAGVSKVGSYTGTGALQTVNCGFTSGARFILIKRTDSTGNWYLYDSARGITSGNDPYLLLNTTGTSELGTNYVDTDSTGFKVTAAAPAELNANGGNFIFLAIS